MILHDFNVCPIEASPVLIAMAQCFINAVYLAWQNPSLLGIELRFSLSYVFTSTVCNGES